MNSTARQTAANNGQTQSDFQSLLSKPRQGIVDTAAQTLGVPPAKVCDLLRNVWKVSQGQPPLSDQEMFTGLSLIARYGLDPITREVYVTRTKSGLATIVGIDGWVKILNGSPEYDGFEQDLEWNESGERLVCVETRIYRKDRGRPTTYRAYERECTALGGFMHGKIPWHMLRLFSLRHAARLSFPVGGNVVTEEEAKWMDSTPATAKKPEVSDINERIARSAPQTPAYVGIPESSVSGTVESIDAETGEITDPFAELRADPEYADWCAAVESKQTIGELAALMNEMDSDTKSMMKNFLKSQQKRIKEAA